LPRLGRTTVQAAMLGSISGAPRTSRNTPATARRLSYIRSISTTLNSENDLLPDSI